MKRLSALLLAVAISGCTDADSARRALENNGFTEIEITGWRWFGCDQKDAFHTGFRALNTNGRQIEGVVCSGWFKGSTVRYD